MTGTRRSAATSVSFRRNIKWFLAILVGFLITIILILLLVLQTTMSAAVEEARRARAATADASADALSAIGLESPTEAIDARLVSLRGRLGIPGIAIETRDERTIRSGQTFETLMVVERRIPLGTLQLYFDDSALHNLERRHRQIVTIVLLSTTGGVVLLLLLLPKIVKPIDTLLEQARALGERSEDDAEDHYLIETFRRSIEKLTAQEEELRRLHEFEKARADDLDRITSTLTRSLNSGFIALDPSGNVVDLNRAAREILKVPDTNASSGPVEEIFGRTTFASVLQEMFRERQSLSRHELRDEDLSIIVGLTTVPLYNREDEFLGMLILFTDLSGIRHLEDRVREMEALASLGQMAAGIAHELRNSLGTILGYLKLARRQKDQRSATEKVAQAEKEGQRLNESINALLRFARPVEIVRERVDLASLVRQSLERLASDTRGLEIRTDLEPVEIEADPALLETAIENLLRNAVEALEGIESGQIFVSSGRSSGVARFTVVDNGCGIEEALLPLVFLPFQTGRASGTGLGLALTRKIVLLHGGEIGIESESGKGTTVRVELPVTE